MTPNLNQLKLKYRREIEFAADVFGDHEGVNSASIIYWLAQFPKRAQPTAVKVLKEIDYFAASNIRKLTIELIKQIHDEHKGIKPSEIAYIPIGRPGSGSALIARVLQNSRGIPKNSIMTVADIERLKPGSKKVFAFLDDFSGTGQGIKEWWQMVEPLVLPKHVDIVFGILVLNHRARTEISSIAPTFSSCDLDDSKNVFHDSCLKFSPDEKDQILTACQKTFCSPDFLKGKGDCGLLTVFKHACPNNSLPILWHDTKAWQRLFHRHGL